METINKLRLVYPSPKDIELFPGGKQPFHVESYYFCSLSINVISLYLTTKTTNKTEYRTLLRAASTNLLRQVVVAMDTYITI